MSEQSVGPITPPAITPEMRAGARAHPNTWLYVVDPALDPGGEVPPWGVIGAYPVDASGEIRAAFRRNTAYRPSGARAPERAAEATTQATAQPANDLERTLRLIESGHADQAALPAAVLRSSLLLYATSPTDRSVTGFPARNGTIMVPACTSVAHVPPAWPGWRQIAGADLVPLLHDHPLMLNPAGPFPAMIPAEILRRASG